MNKPPTPGTNGRIPAFQSWLHFGLQSVRTTDSAGSLLTARAPSLDAPLRIAGGLHGFFALTGDNVGMEVQGCAWNGVPKHSLHGYDCRGTFDVRAPFFSSSTMTLTCR